MEVGNVFEVDLVKEDAFIVNVKGARIAKPLMLMNGVKASGD